jgi:hypothetical protein
MSFLLLSSFLFLGFQVQANEASLGEKFCYEQAFQSFQDYHQHIVDQMGPIEAYVERLYSEDYSQVINDIDQRDETYTFEVYSEQANGDYWISEYKIYVEAWVQFDEQDHLKPLCGVKEIDFRIHTEGNIHEEN